MAAMAVTAATAIIAATAAATTMPVTLSTVI